MPLGSDELLAECVRGIEELSPAYTFTICAPSLDRAATMSVWANWRGGHHYSI